MEGVGRREDCDCRNGRRNDNGCEYGQASSRRRRDKDLRTLSDAEREGWKQEKKSSADERILVHSGRESRKYRRSREYDRKPRPPSD
jgi:hypothetical protein